MFYNLSLQAVLSLFLVVGRIAALLVTVTTTNGTVQSGNACNNGNTNMFLAIPYATAPVGDLRFAAPEPYNSTYNLVATLPAPNCAQFGSLFIESGAQSEDCLFLDIYAPSNVSKQSAVPVKVWLYGGFNEAGGISDPTYNGCFAAADSIFVSVNYRLGPLGFLSLSSAGIQGNFGLQDQMLALQWIQENIAAFGGDPKRVLLFGQSAGAADAFVLSTLSQAQSLFSAAALESGNRQFPTIQEAEEYNAIFAQKLNCSITDLGCLRAASLTGLQGAILGMPSMSAPGANSLLENSGKGVAWGPVIDGSIVKEQPSVVGIQVPTIFGSNVEDGTLFVLGSYGTAVGNISGADYDTFLNDNFGPLASIVNRTYALDKFSALPFPGFAAITTVLTEYGFYCPIYRSLARAASNGIPVFAYQFNHTPSCAWYSGVFENPIIRSILGSTHTAEIPFVFGLTTDLPPPSGNCSFTPSEVAISEFMVGSWTSMAASQKPSSNQTWPAWTVNESLGIVVNEAVEVTRLDFSVCSFWDQIDAEILQLDQKGTNATNTASATVSTPTSTSSSSSTTISTSASMTRTALGNIIMSASMALVLTFLMVF